MYILINNAVPTIFHCAGGIISGMLRLAVPCSTCTFWNTKIKKQKKSRLLSKQNLNLVSNKKSGTNIYYIYITGNRPSALTPPKYIPLLEDGSVPIVFKNCSNLPNKFIHLGMAFKYSVKEIIVLRHETTDCTGRCSLIHVVRNLSV